VPNATPDEGLQTYLRELEKERHEAWQAEQARQSVVTWFAWRRGQEKRAGSETCTFTAERFSFPYTRRPRIAYGYVNGHERNYNEKIK
jgi:hypothetical protein